MASALRIDLPSMPKSAFTNKPPWVGEYANSFEIRQRRLANQVSTTNAAWYAPIISNKSVIIWIETTLNTVLQMNWIPLWINWQNYGVIYFAGTKENIFACHVFFCHQLCAMYRRFKFLNSIFPSQHILLPIHRISRPRYSGIISCCNFTWDVERKTEWSCKKKMQFNLWYKVT